MVPKTTWKASALRPQVGRLIDGYEDAVHNFRETGRANAQTCLLSAEQLRKLFQPVKEDVKIKMVYRFARDMPPEEPELKQGWNSWIE